MGLAPLRDDAREKLSRLDATCVGRGDRRLSERASNEVADALRKRDFRAARRMKNEYNSLFMREEPKAEEGAVAAQPPRAPRVAGEPRSKTRMLGGCLRSDYLAKREKAAEVGKAEGLAEWSKSAAATALVGWAILTEDKREWRRDNCPHSRTKARPSPPSSTRR